MRGDDKREADLVGSLKSSLMAQILLWRALNKYLVMWGTGIPGESYTLKDLLLVSSVLTSGQCSILTCSVTASSVFDVKSQC